MAHAPQSHAWGVVIHLQGVPGGQANKGLQLALSRTQSLLGLRAREAGLAHRAHALVHRVTADACHALHLGHQALPPAIVRAERQLRILSRDWQSVNLTLKAQRLVHMAGKYAAVRMQYAL